MKTFSTLHIKYEINNHPSLVHTYRLLEEKALSKGYFLYVTDKLFFIYRNGMTVGTSPLFQTEDISEMFAFVDQAETIKP